jgi:signal transduction histidine kinase
VTSRLPGTEETALAGNMREMQVAREIAHAFLTSSHPSDVYRLALERVTPLVGATFGCVFLREGDEDLLQVVAAQNWPEEYGEYLSEMRVRVGLGPTGQAVAENRVVEVRDIFSDPDLEDWWDPARELGFTASVSLPLAFQNRQVGALTFYFAGSDSITGSDHSQLLRLVADQLAATAEKAHLIDDLQRANDLLREQNVDLEARYREAAEAKRLKSEFLANVSHELRTPLTAILGYSYLLREGLNGTVDGEQRSAVDKIEAAGNVLMTLINSLLDLTHLKLGKTQVVPELCDAVAISRAVISSAPQPVQGVGLSSEAPAEKVPIHTDPALVIRILENMVSNAIKFTPDGSVTLRLRVEAGQNGGRRGPTVVWEVEDTGIGISADHQAAIFDEFRQVDGTTTRRFGGAGLGLALSRGLARRLGGDIDVESVPGEGSRFSLRLPAAVIHAGAEGHLVR